MATRKYRRTVHEQWAGGANPVNFAVGPFRWALVDAAVVPADTTITGHRFVSDIRAGIIAETANLAGGQFTDALYDADDPVLPDAGGGATGEYLVLFQWTGADGTSRLIVCSDDATNLPLTLDGVDDEIQHAVQGITQFG